MAKPTRQRIVLGCGSDEAYADRSLVMLASAIEKTPEADFDIHYLHPPEFTVASCGRLRNELIRRNPQTRIQFHSIPDAWIRGLPILAGMRNKLIKPVMWYRIFFPELLPTVSKLLYLDSDLLVMDSLWPLWSLDLQEKSLAAVTNPFDVKPKYARIWKLPALLDIPRLDYYFNSGVMLMNLVILREQKVAKKLVEHGRQHADISFFADQDSLCAVLYRERIPISPRWNLMWSIFSGTNTPDIFDSVELFESIRKPAIVHFDGPVKPWLDPSAHPYGRAYVRYARAFPGALVSKPWGFQDIKNFFLRRQWRPGIRLIHWFEAMAESLAK